VALIAALIVAALAWWLFEKSRRRTHPVPAGHRPEITLPYEQPFELYHNALSLCSMKTRACLAELRIPYASHPIDLIETGSYETLSRHFLAINPGGTVPVLVHEGHPIYESHEQIRYAAEHAPAGSPALVPEDPAQREEMQRWIDRSSLTHDPLNHGDQSAGNAVPGLTLQLFAAMIDRIAYSKILVGLLFHFEKQRPLMFISVKTMGLEGMGRLRPLVGLIARSRRQLATHLDALETQLASHGGPFILGDAFSLADVSWMVIFERLRQAASLDAFLGEGERPHCAAYWDALRERPGYREGILGHPHPMIDYGTERLIRAKSADPALKAVLEGDAAPARDE
jgi:glutathione S-transferase